MYENGQVGPYSDITFDLPKNISVSVQARQNYKSDQYYYDIRFQIPKGLKTKFVSEKIVITQEDNITLQAPKTMYLFAHKSSDVNSLYTFNSFCPIVKDDPNSSDGNTRMGVRTVLDVNYSSPPKQLKIQLPNISINEKKQTVTPMFLKGYQDLKSVFYLSDEMQNKRLSRYEECLKKTPQSRCKNFITVFHDSYSFSGDDLNISARVFWSYWSKKLRIITDVKSLASNTWNFCDSTVQLEDMSTHSITKAEFDSVSVDCLNYYALAINTTIDNKIDSMLWLHIRGLLGDEKGSNISIQLPDMLINDSLYHFQPIKLKLHLIGGGIDPIL